MAATDTPTAPRLSKKERTRRKIAEAAFGLFADHGFDAVRLTDIAHAADVAPATVFTHYGSKEEIFFSRRGEFNEGLAAAVGGASDLHDLIGRLHAFYRDATGLVLHGDAVERGRVFARILLDSPALMRAYSPLERERRDLLAQTIAEHFGPDEGVHEGETELLAALAAAVAATAFDVMHEQLAAGKPVDQVREDVDAALTRGFDKLRTAYPSGVRAQ
ncbi:TetR/AcrR family transcriptional regulator [Kitasatospora sp. NPDC096077]|uniref:TetR/AcrR family transcriptional regulator n=1 Tax=Kitasatospora sp. NPDC096077 TaxID=3155544 RepID=UPI00332EDAD7